MSCQIRLGKTYFSTTLIQTLPITWNCKIMFKINPFIIQVIGKNNYIFDICFIVNDVWMP